MFSTVWAWKIKNYASVEQSFVTRGFLSNCDVNTDLILLNEPDLEHTLDLVGQVQNHSLWKVSVLAGLCSPAAFPPVLYWLGRDWRITESLTPDLLGCIEQSLKARRWMSRSSAIIIVCLTSIKAARSHHCENNPPETLQRDWQELLIVNVPMLLIICH